MVGGPGFEPGASRSRTLRTSVQKSLKQSISVRFFGDSLEARPDLRRSPVRLLHELLHNGARSRLESALGSEPALGFQYRVSSSAPSCDVCHSRTGVAQHLPAMMLREFGLLHERSPKHPTVRDNAHEVRGGRRSSDIVEQDHNIRMLWGRWLLPSSRLGLRAGGRRMAFLGHDDHTVEQPDVFCCL
jgi:hypothetical protein